MRQRPAGRVRPWLRFVAARHRLRALAQPRRQEHGHGVFQSLAHCERGGRTAGLQAHRARRRPRIIAHPRRRASHSGLRGAAGRHQPSNCRKGQRPHRQHQCRVVLLGLNCCPARPRIEARATKWAHILRLVEYPRPYRAL